MYTTIDAHADGGGVRLITGGYPAPRGRTMRERQRWAANHADGIRLALLRPPRGHSGLAGAVFTEPATPGAAAGLLFMHADGYSPLLGHALVGAITIALERSLVVLPDEATTCSIDTVAGSVPVRVERGTSGEPRRVHRITYRAPPASVVAGGVPVVVRSRPIRADVADASGRFAIVDAESIGVALAPAHERELRAAGLEVAAGVEAAMPAATGERTRTPVAGAIFIGPAGSSSADVRSVAVLRDGLVERVPSGSGAAALVAVLDAMGLAGDRWIVHEGILGTTVAARIAARGAGERPPVTVELEGSAWITGDHTFVTDPADPLKEGYAWP